MTQEEKLNEAKKLYESVNADQRYVLESLFPELRESEDEKTKRVLHSIANKMSQHLRDIFSEEEFQCYDAWSNALLEKQGEQKPAEWSEIDKVNLEDSIYFVKEFRRSNLCDNESRLQNSRTCIEWLASLKDRVLPQPKQGWSEEDKAIIDYLLQLIDNSHKEPCTKGLIAFGAEAWLKSLRPQNRWKPSDEQMNALNYVVNLMASSERPTENDLYYNILKSLRQQLMKLKG